MKHGVSVTGKTESAKLPRIVASVAIDGGRKNRRMHQIVRIKAELGIAVTRMFGGLDLASGGPCIKSTKYYFSGDESGSDARVDSRDLSISFAWTGGVNASGSRTRGLGVSDQKRLLEEARGEGVRQQSPRRGARSLPISRESACPKMPRKTVNRGESKCQKPTGL